ncbi:hypothetical protein ARMGADRAFT_1036555 [Armillaria gallica]|uniref:Uncharacterized protein n=1 Tax=Armillaria gallica TaxID=47427 RepID=A0A2H3D3B3_ARMGA|nr:hypothetical protein ARMGADRAFT_1036555 [Armillaria gallica]
MASTANDDTLSAALLLPVDTTALKKKKKSKKKATATTVTTDSILQQQQQLDVTANITSDVMSLFTFLQATKEFEEAYKGGENLKEALMHFWRHAYHLGEDDGHFEVARDMEQAGYQKGYDATLMKLTAAEHQVEGECTAGWQA